MAKKLFGTDGIRGIPGEYPLDDATLGRVGTALGEYLTIQKPGAGGGPIPRVLIGRDTRESGPHIMDKIARGLAAAGAEPVSAGVVDHAGRGVAREPRRIFRGRGDFRIAQSVSRQRREADFVVGHEISGCGGSGNRALDSFAERATAFRYHAWNECVVCKQSPSAWRRKAARRIIWAGCARRLSPGRNSQE